MKLVFADQAWEDYLYWQKQDKKMIERINKLIREVQREPFSGLGKPEPLKHALSGFWSRRINDEHRVYAILYIRSGWLPSTDRDEPCRARCQTSVRVVLGLEPLRKCLQLLQASRYPGLLQNLGLRFGQSRRAGGR